MSLQWDDTNESWTEKFGVPREIIKCSKIHYKKYIYNTLYTKYNKSQWLPKNLAFWYDQILVDTMTVCRSLKRCQAMLCTKRQGHKISIDSFTLCSPDFLWKTGGGRLVTREAQRTVSLGTLLYLIPPSKALRLHVLGEQNPSVCRGRLSSLWRICFLTGQK